MVVLMVIGGAIGASAAIRTDQVLFEPGSVRGTAGLVEVSGTKSYPMKGDVLFATVSVRQATLFDRVFRRPLDDTLRFTPMRNTALSRIATLTDMSSAEENTIFSPSGSASACSAGCGRHGSALNAAAITPPPAP